MGLREGRVFVVFPEIPESVVNSWERPTGDKKGRLAPWSKAPKALLWVRGESRLLSPVERYLPGRTKGGRKASGRPGGWETSSVEESGSCLRVRCVVSGPESKGVPCEFL